MVQFDPAFLVEDPTVIKLELQAVSLHTDRNRLLHHCTLQGLGFVGRDFRTVRNAEFFPCRLVTTLLGPGHVLVVELVGDSVIDDIHQCLVHVPPITALILVGAPGAVNQLLRR